MSIYKICRGIQMRGYKIIFLAGILLASLTSSAMGRLVCEPIDEAAIITQPQGETFPWPWGAECPFPWVAMEGLWQINQGSLRQYFEFSAKNETSDGKRIFKIKHFDKDFRLVSVGKGIANKSQRIVYAALTSTSSNVGYGRYYAIFRSFASNSKLGCSGAKQDKIVTIRPIRECGEKASEGQHYRIEKMK